MIADQKGVPEIFTPDSNPYGVTYSEWTVRWWQWCLSQPNAVNPVNDLGDSKNSANGQVYPEVWFLAGTTGGHAVRKCTIPQGKAILSPIINFSISTAEDPTLQTDEALMLTARTDVDKIAKVGAVMDGMELPSSMKFRIHSRPFDITLPEDNIWGVKAGPTRAAADGYWLFIKPLPAGKHSIRFGGSCLAGTINIGADYDILVH